MQDEFIEPSKNTVSAVNTSVEKHTRYGMFIGADLKDKIDFSDKTVPKCEFFALKLGTFELSCQKAGEIFSVMDAEMLAKFFLGTVTSETAKPMSFEKGVRVREILGDNCQKVIERFQSFFEGLKYDLNNPPI